MRIVIQRVTRASVSIEGRVESAIEKGMMVLLGVGYADTDDDIDWLVKKTINLRIFDDSEGVMNLSVKDVEGSILVVSQFTLMASCKKGNRPSYIHAPRCVCSALQTVLPTPFRVAWQARFHRRFRCRHAG